MRRPSLLLAAALAGCYASSPFPGGTDGGADPPPDVRIDPRPDPAVEPAPDSVACPPDDATHLYITVSGTVRSVDRRDVRGLSVRGISLLEALMPGDPEPLAEATVAEDWSFTLRCMDVGAVALGVVASVDDPSVDGVDGSWFPTGTLVAEFTTPDEKVDVSGARAYALPYTIREGLEGLTGTSGVLDGHLMGLVLDERTGDPVEGAVVIQSPPGPIAPAVGYPSPDFASVDFEGSTSAGGLYMFLAPVRLMSFSALAEGYSFEEVQGATKPGFCFFVVLEGAR